MANKKRPAVPTIPLDQKFVQVDYNGTKYNLRVDLDLNSKNFLKVTEIQYGGSFSTNLVAYPTDAENKVNAKPYGGPFSPAGGLGSAGTKLFNEVISSAESKQAVASELSSLYGTVKPNIQEEWKKSANNAGTNTVLSQIVPGPGLFQQNPEQPALSSVVPGPTTVSTATIALPDEIKALQDTADKTIQSLLTDPEKSRGKEFVSLQYPRDAYYGNSQDHVIIEQFTYKAPQEDLLSSQGQLQTGGVISAITSGLKRNTNLRDFVGLVKLPIPNQLAVSNGVSWADDRANAVEAGAFFSALGVASKNLTGNIPDAISSVASGVGNITNLIGSGGFGNTPAGILLSSFLAQAALGKIGLNVDPAQFIARATGTTINPNLELLFNGPKLRNFSFTFEFAPVDEYDARISRRVMRFFNQGMVPKKNESNTIFIGSPNVFRIRYSNGKQRIKGLNIFKICALTNCEINFTPEGVYQSYDDSDAGSQPVRTTMTLSFTELTPIFENDYFMDEISQNASSADLFERSGGIGPLDQITPDDIGF